ncbi:MAG: hypothetical protein CVV49_08220 [Spirochaetae bacterium HGW-Spirochaetae-5]|nr:MAG: hypothetical protein CVV49_08220 [Spirochaetae bacterium HGW-Spirochaetae-5]
MITVIFKNLIFNEVIDLNNSSTLYLEVSGHSDLNKKGNDILCSAVSVLTQTFVLTVNRVLKIKQQVNRGEGFLSSLIDLKDVSAEDKLGLKLLIESLLIGLLEINGEYPDKLKIEFVND